jgi:transcriptional regulator with XRE-family HTH domain
VIKNDRQLGIANKRLADIEESMTELDKAEDVQVFISLAQEVRAEVAKYLAVRDKKVNLFSISSADDIGPAVVNARISRGWTQRDLAERLGVSEQMVQKDERHEYENVGLAKLAELLDVLEYELVGSLRPTHIPSREWRGESGVSFAGGVPLFVSMHEPELETVRVDARPYAPYYCSNYVFGNVFTASSVIVPAVSKASFDYLEYPATVPDVWWRTESSATAHTAGVVTP